MEIALLIISVCASLFVLYLVALAVLMPLSAIFTGLGHLLGGEFARKNTHSRALRERVRNLLAEATEEDRKGGLTCTTYVKLVNAVQDVLRDEHKPPSRRDRVELHDLLDHMRAQYPDHAEYLRGWKTFW